MHIRNYILTIFTTLTAAMTMAVSLPVCSQEIANQDTLVADDSLAVDTIVNNDPEWYVAPLTHDLTRAPRRAAGACPIDSVRTFNVDSVLESVSVYEYGDTTRTMIWTVNADGSRYGSGREESASTANSTYSATYTWDFTTNNWAGVSREEHYFVAGKDTAWLVYTWVDNAWVVNTKYTYVYDAAGRETEFTTYERNASGQLAYSKQRIREYNAAGKTTLDIQYTAHNGSDWSAGTKRIYNYEGNNTILDEYYSSYTNGAWVGSAKKVWGYTAGRNTYYEQFGWSNGAWVSSYKENLVYTAGNKTYYEKNTWSNNAWVGTTKEIWAYFNDNAKKQSLHKKYGWANGDWAISQCDSSVYDAAGNNTLVENYTYTNGVQKGSKKEEYTYSGSTKIATIAYKWYNNAWVYNVWTVSDKVSNPNESCKYNWSATANAWIGTGARTLTTNNSSNKPIEVITQSWSTAASSWLNYTRKTTAYEGAKTTQEATYTWSVEANDWVGATRSDWHYNAQGKNDTIKTYTNNGAEWIYSDRTAKTYNAAGTEIMVHNAHWNGEKWVMTSMTRNDIIKDAAGHELLNASWRCEADSIWIGLQKDTTTYTASGEMLYKLHCESWANNNWVPKYKVELEYDNEGHVLMQQQMDWVSNDWKGYYRYEWQYDEDGNQTIYASYSGWNTTTNNWIGLNKTEYEYENGQVKEYVRYNWSDGWIPSRKYKYLYDNQSRTIQYIVQLYASGTWVNSQKNETDYKGDEICKDNSYIWLNNQWVYSSRNESYYDDDEQAKLRRQVTGSWSNGNVLSFADNHYFYACDPHAFTIRFENENGTLLQSKQVMSGEVPEYTGETPTKQADAQYTYAFAGWDAALVAATSDATYTATYSSTLNKYLITFKNGEEVLQSEPVAYGTVPAYNGEQPAKQADAQYTYSFKGWTPAIVAVTGDAVYTAEYDSVVNRYRITWLNADEVEVAVDSLEYGAMPSHEDVVKPSTSEWAYLFAGWSPAIVAVTGDATYKAQLDSIQNGYRITWLDVDDSELAADSLAYGAMPSHEYVLKANTAEWTYSFVGWTPAITSVTGDATYKAQIDSVRNSYRITWLNADEVEVAADSLAYGATPSHEDLVKTNTAEWTYSFVGWEPAITSVTGDATYKAQIDSVRNSYRITWLNADDVEVAADSLAYGATPNHEDLVKTNTAEWTYSFVGWTPAITSVTGDATYKAQFDSVRNGYLVTFKNDGDTLQSTLVAYGTMPVYGGETPTKQADAQYSYAFAGWDAELVAVTGEATYNATFSNTLNKYLITFKNGDETLQSTEVEYGTTPSYTGVTPTKPADAQYTYAFDGWDAELVAVTGEATYNATFSSTVNKYLITFKNGDETLQSTEVEYGTTPSYTGVTPTKQADAQYSYAFAGWDAEVVAVVGEATYNATFSSTVNKYLITFKNGDETLQSTEVEYGSVPAYEGATPTKPSDAQYSYAFAGWDAELVAVTGEATYNATFTATLNSYTITWLNADGSLIETNSVSAGDTPAHADIYKESTAQYTYTFKGWTPAIVPANSDATYTAEWDSVVNKYTITFLFDDGITVMETVEVEYGQMPATTITPSKIAEKHYYYTFIGWTPAVVPVSGEATYTAIFDTIPQEYLITFKNYNGMVLQETNVPYGTMPEYTGATPEKPRTQQYSYEFSGWNPELTEVAGATTYIAQFEAVLNQYTVVFLDEDGTELDRQVVDYGSMPVYQGETPVKAEDEQYTYTFAGWYPTVVTVTKDATYRATYTAHDKSQGLWGVQDGEPSSTKVIRNGTLYILRAGKTYTTDGVMVE